MSRDLPRGIRVVHGTYHYRFMLAGQEYSGGTKLAATGRKAARNLDKAVERMVKAKDLVRSGQADQLRTKPITFNRASEQFLEYCDGEYAEHPNSARRIRGSFASLGLFLGATPVHAITTGRIEDFKAWRRVEHVIDGETIAPVKEVTIRHDLHALSLFLQYGRKQGWLAGDPLENVEIPSDAEAERIYVISEAEERSYFALALRLGLTDAHDLGRVMLQQGCRPEEVISLRKDDLDLAAGTLTVVRGKSKASRRTLYLTAEVRSLLGVRLSGKGQWLFPSSRVAGQHIGIPYSQHTRILDEMGYEENGGWVPYDWRHTFATRMAIKGMDLPRLAAIMGHANLRTIQRYIHIAQHDMDDAMVVYGGAPPRQVDVVTGVRPS